jgi:hypothetical protein
LLICNSVNVDNYVNIVNKLVYSVDNFVDIFISVFIILIVSLLRVEQNISIWYNIVSNALLALFQGDKNYDQL